MMRWIHTARALFAAVALGAFLPVSVLAQGTPGAGAAAPGSTAVPSPGALPGTGGVELPSPQPEPTQSGTPLPYPAYGTPAPDVAALKPRTGVPTTIDLSQAVKIAVALSPAFANENAQWAAIHARYTAAKQLYYPNIGVSGSLTQSRTVTQTYNVSSGGISPTTIPSATPAPFYATGTTTTVPTTTGGKTLIESGTITLQQLIFDGGRTIADIRSTKEADYAGRATLLRDLETLELNVANAYFAVLQDNATVVADNQLVHEFEINQAAVVAQIRNGAAARSDLATAEFQTAQARGNLVSAQGTAIGAQSTFATSLGLDADTTVVPKDIGTNQPGGGNPTYQGSLARALLMRPDYISAQHSVESYKENLRYAKLARFPLITGIASDGTARTVPQYTNGSGAAATTLREVSGINTNYVPTFTIGLQVSVPIYDQGTTNYNVANAAALLDQAFATLQQTRLQVQSDVRTALANLISARALLVETQAELISGRVSLDATQAQYRVGATTIINVVTAEANLATAQSAYITSLYGVQTAQQNYLYATGLSDIQL